MKNFFNFTFWPALAGLVFAVALLLTPRLVERIPALAIWFPPLQSTQSPAVPVRISYNSAIRGAAPAVVSINYSKLVGRDERTRLFLTPTGLRAATFAVPVEDTSLGSGVIIHPEGYIITSYHVVFGEEDEKFIGNTSKPIISLFDRRELEGRIVALDEKNDLALLKVDAENLPWLELADEKNLLVGDLVMAIGNPRNIGQSVTQGIISALWRRNDSYIIQTDAAINPGNSGGALIDAEGKLIGINSTIVSESGGSEGISFAIPGSLALDLLQDYLASGPSGYIGVSGEAITLSRGRTIFDADVQGFLINDVSPGSPADKAGIRLNDVITGVNETKFNIIDDQDKAEAFRAISVISDLPPGELIVLEVFRAGNFMQMPVILGVGEPEVLDLLVEEE